MSNSKASLGFYSLDKNQTNIIKGLAIFMIVFHNFLHLRIPLGENELILDPHRIFKACNMILASPNAFFIVVFTYLGHYGVQLFIFISGYGLAKQYASKKTISYKNYLIPKLLKIYSLLILGIVVVCLIQYLTNVPLSWIKSFVISSLLMFNNFNYDRIFLFIGPWWYFSLAIQLYLVFPVLFKVIDKYAVKGYIALTVVSYILIYSLWGICEQLRIPIFGNFIGHLPEFLLGIILAVSPKLKISWPIVLLALVVFLLGNLYQAFFPFTFLSITILMLVCFYWIYQHTNTILTKGLAWLGGISMFVFVINGPLRTFKFLEEGQSSLKMYLGAIIHFIMVLIVSWIMSVIYKKTIAPYLHTLIKKTTK